MTTNAQAAVQAAATLGAADIRNGSAATPEKLFTTAEEIKGWLDRQDAKQQTPDWAAEAHALERSHGIIGRPDTKRIADYAREAIRDIERGKPDTYALHNILGLLGEAGGSDNA